MKNSRENIEINLKVLYYLKKWS